MRGEFFRGHQQQASIHVRYHNGAMYRKCTLCKVLITFLFIRCSEILLCKHNLHLHSNV